MGAAAGNRPRKSQSICPSLTPLSCCTIAFQVLHMSSINLKRVSRDRINSEAFPLIDISGVLDLFAKMLKKIGYLTPVVITPSAELHPPNAKQLPHCELSTQECACDLLGGNTYTYIKAFRTSNGGAARGFDKKEQSRRIPLSFQYIFTKLYIFRKSLDTHIVHTHTGIKGVNARRTRLRTAGLSLVGQTILRLHTLALQNAAGIRTDEPRASRGVVTDGETCL